MNKLSSVERLKVLFVCGSLPPIKCGVGYYCQIILDKLTSKNVDIDIVKTLGSGKQITTNRTLEVPDWKLRRISKILKFIKKSSAEIVHIEYPALGYKRNLGINFLPYFIRLFTNKKIIVTLHEYHGSPLIGRCRNLLTAFPANNIFVSNEADKQSLPALISKKTSIVPIGSNIQKAKNNSEVCKRIFAKAGLKTNAPTIVFFGFPYPSKNLDQLIRAMAELEKMQLIIIADLINQDEYQRYLLKEISSSPAKSRIGVTGFLPDVEVSIVLQNCRYFVLPQSIPITGKSGTGIAAAIHNNILITTGNDLKSYPFKDNKNAYFIDSPDAQKLSDAINQLEKNQLLRAKIINGTKILSGYFDWDNIISLHIKEYLGLK